MKVVFVNCGAEGLGVQYLSAALKQEGHQTSLVFDPTLFDDKVFLNIPFLAKVFNYTNEVAEDVIKEKPDLVAISIVTDTYQWAVKVAKDIKKKCSVPIIAGGTHPTIVPEEVIRNKCFDMLCIGEGEQAIVEVANALEKGKSIYGISNIWARKGSRVVKNAPRSLIRDLNKLAFPDRTIYEPYLNPKDDYLAMSGRGCIYNCSYCFNNAMKKIYRGKGTYLRRRSPENFVEELVLANQKYDFKILKIYDDIFTYDVSWLERFAKLYKKKVGKPYFCLGHPRFLGEKAVKLLKQSNCCWVQIGIESTNQQTRKVSCERPETNEEINEMIRVLDKHKLPYELDHIFGLPGDREEDYVFATRFYKKCKSLLKVNTNILSYIPNTEVVEKGLSAKKINKKDLSEIVEGKESSRVSLGSERNKELLDMYLGFIVIFKAIKIIPGWLLEIMLKHRFYIKLKRVDPIAGYLARIASADKIDTLYVKQVLSLLFWRIKRYVQ